MSGAAAIALAALALAIWAGLLGFRGGFWRAAERLPRKTPALERRSAPWPAVVCVMPARNEAPTVAAAVRSLIGQDYPGAVRVIVVDDQSEDGTAEAAEDGAAGAARDGRSFGVVPARPLEAGWTGKLWALARGLEAVDADHADAPYLLLTDADIEHGPGSLGRLVAKAETDGLDLVSVMARLRCESFWERLLIPAFVFFFQKLYPFPWVNDPGRPTAAAAGGCMLVRRRALAAAGGIAAIRGRLIDDCALAGLLKARGPVWLGLADDVTSLRAYPTLAEVWSMVSRTAFAQLGHSPAMLVVAVAGMTVAYGVPPLAALGLLGGGGWAAALGLVTWLGPMSWAYAPTLRLYGRPAAWALTLPLAALLYTLMTVSSALGHWRGRGGAWKGRHYPAPPRSPRAADG